jgi:hypothetical protein
MRELLSNFGNCICSQVDAIADMITRQAWEGLVIVDDLPGRGRGLVTSQQFRKSQVVCDYGGNLMSHKAGRAKYATTKDGEAEYYMYEFSFQGTRWWRDATFESNTCGRLINHSKCHPNVS